MNKLFFRLFGLDKKQLSDKSVRYLVKFEVFLLIAGGISVLMGIINPFIDRSFAAVADLVFGAVCFADFVVLRFVKKVSFVNYILFGTVLVVYMADLLITGGTAGYGVYWLLLLPFLAIGFLGIKRGAAISALMFLILSIILWVPPLRELCRYEYSFRFRVIFSVLYAAFFTVKLISEAMCLSSLRELLKIQKNLQSIAEKDSLTDTENRVWFNKHFMDRYDGKILPTSGVAFLIDIDDFKSVNDTYGHLAGDEILCRSVETIRRHIGDNILCRWGGEEFFGFISDCGKKEARDLLENIRLSVEGTGYRYKEHDNIKITVSIGAVYIEKNTVIDVEKILFETDKQMYVSKARGKNRVTFF